MIISIISYVSTPIVFPEYLSTNLPSSTQIIKVIKQISPNPTETSEKRDKEYLNPKTNMPVVSLS